MSNILFKFPTRNRPAKVIDCLKTLTKNIENKDNYKIVLNCDLDDITMNNCISEIKSFPNTDIIFDYSKNKIHAMNRDMDKIDYKWDIMVMVSDDFDFYRFGFDNIIRLAFESYFPDYDGLVHFPDGYRNDLITLSIIGKKYYDIFNYIYNPEYISLYADNEQMEVAKILNKYKFVNILFCKHEHPNNNRNVEYDNQYKETEKYYGIDSETFRKRKEIDFDLQTI